MSSQSLHNWRNSSRLTQPEASRSVALHGIEGLGAEAASLEVRGFHLLVMSADEFATVPLPATGAAIIGRSANAYLRIEDPGASRRHARLTVGETITIEDLGSANGTRVRGEPIAAGTLVVVHPGEAIAIGSTVLMVQRNRSDLQPRRLWSHGHFEARLAEECVRSAATGTTFAVVRVGLERAAPWPQVLPFLAEHLRQPHVLASYGPHDYELLLVQLAPPAIEDLCATLARALEEAGCPARLGVASFPRDGRSPDALLSTANTALRRRASRITAVGAAGGASAMERTVALAKPAAGRAGHVLVLGPQGAGKELVALAVHQLSPRGSRPFVTLRCAGRAGGAIERDLPGLVESAEGGSLLVDEVAALPALAQARLVRAIDEGDDGEGGRLAVRFIATSSHDLEAEVLAGRFRFDLLQRLAGARVEVPPLCQRRAELRGLIDTLLINAGRDSGRPTLSISTQALSWLERYHWPGNIRELENVIDRALVLCDDDEIGLPHLPVEKLAGGPLPPGPVAEMLVASSAGTSPDPARAAERVRILDALESCAWNQSRAAEVLGISRRTLVSRLEAHGIPRPQKIRGQV
jgi:two-component system response regulator AtoC